MLDTAVKTTEWMVMSFRPNKFATLTHPPNDMQFNIKDHTLPTIEIGDTYKYLEVPTGIDSDQIPYRGLEEMVSDTHKLSKSKLYPWQFFNASKTYIASKLVFAMRTREFRIGALSCSGRKAANKNKKQYIGKYTKKPWVFHHHKTLILHTEYCAYIQHVIEC